MLQDVLQERCLVGGKTLAAAEHKQESIAVFDKHGREFGRSLGNRHTSSLVGSRAARAMIE